jgi:hypothetical protein
MHPTVVDSSYSAPPQLRQSFRIRNLKSLGRFSNSVVLVTLAVVGFVSLKRRGAAFAAEQWMWCDLNFPNCLDVSPQPGSVGYFPRLVSV